MVHSIHNQFLEASFSTKGAELKSLRSKATGFEYIWQADPEYWNRSAPILFPIVGEVNGGMIRVGDTSYSLSRHGFARDSEFTLTQQSDTQLVFTLVGNEQTRQYFPFDFSFSVIYTLEGTALVTTFTVENKGAKPLYFSVGAHPAFNLPGDSLNECYIEFEKTETLRRYLLVDNLFSGETEEVVNNSTMLPLAADLFDKDAIVFKELQSQSISIKNKTGDFVLRMDFEGFPYFGIWTKPNCHKFLCLEPWCGLADAAGFAGDIKEKEGIIALPPADTFTRAFSITV